MNLFDKCFDIKAFKEAVGLYNKYIDTAKDFAIVVEEALELYVGRRILRKDGHLYINIENSLNALMHKADELVTQPDHIVTARCFIIPGTLEGTHDIVIELVFERSEDLVEVYRLPFKLPGLFINYNRELERVSEPADRYATFGRLRTDLFITSVTSLVSNLVDMAKAYQKTIDNSIPLVLQQHLPSVALIVDSNGSVPLKYPRTLCIVTSNSTTGDDMKPSDADSMF